MYGTPWTEEDVKTLRRMHEEEEATASQIADKLHCAVSRVRQKAYSMGISLRHEGEWSQHEMSQLAEMAKQDRPSYEIADKLGRTDCAVRAKAYQLDIKLFIPPTDRKCGHRFKWTKEDDARMKKLIYETCSVEDTATALGRTPNAVRMRMSALGVLLREAKSAKFLSETRGT